MTTDDPLAGCTRDLTGDDHPPADNVIRDVEQAQSGTKVIGAEGKAVPALLLPRMQAQLVAIDKPRLDLCGLPVDTLPQELCREVTNLALRSQNQPIDARIDLQGTIVPAYALNSIIGNIPLIGSLLLGGEGQGLFAANYRVTGSAGDPQVSVNPLSALAPGFLRRLFQPNFGLPPPVQQSLGVQ